MKRVIVFIALLLFLAVTVPAVPRDGTSSEDAGNSMETAMNLSCGEYSGMLSDTDKIDYYRHTMDIDGLLRVRVEFTTGDIDVYVYDSMGNLLDSATGTSHTESVECYADYGETLYIKLELYSGDEVEYTILIEEGEMGTDALVIGIIAVAIVLCCCISIVVVVVKVMKRKTSVERTITPVTPTTAPVGPAPQQPMTQQSMTQQSREIIRTTVLIVCPYCGAKVPEGTTHCPNCGAPL